MRRDVANMGLQARTGSDLQENPLAQSHRPFDAFLKQDRVTHIAPPVRRVGGGSGKKAVGYGRKERHDAGRRRQPCKAFEQRFPHWLHKFGVERIGEIEPPLPQLVRRGKPSQPVQRLRGPCDSEAMMGVVRRDRKARNLRDEAGRGVAGAEYHRHSAGVLSRFLETAAVVDQANGVREPQNASRLGGGDLADAVAHRHRRAYSNLGKRAHARRLDRKHHRLRDMRVRKVGLEIWRRQLLGQRPAGQRREVRVDLGQRVPEHRVAAIGGPPHARPLRAVAREDKDDRSVAFGRGPADCGAVGLS